MRRVLARKINNYLLWMREGIRLGGKLRERCLQELRELVAIR